METLKELVQLLSNNKFEQIELLDSASNSLTGQFFNAIKDNKITTDEEASEFLYNETPYSYKFRKLKTRLRDKLLSSLFFIDTGKAYSLEIERAYHNCVKNYAVISILLTKAARKTAMDLAESTLLMAKKYEFTDIAFSISRVLTIHYGAIEKNEKKYNKFKKLTTTFSDILDKEFLAEKYNIEYSNIFLNTKSIQEALSKSNWESSYKEMEELVDEYTTHTFLKNAYRVLFFYNMKANNYSKIIELSESAANKLKQKPYETRNIRFTFHLYAVITHLQLGDYAKAREIIEGYSKLFSPGTYNWFVSNYYFLITATHAEDYNQAHNIVYSVLTNKQFSKLPAGFQQNWLVHEAYMQFLSTIGKVETNQMENTSNKTFRLYKFLNEIPIYSQDKRGLNISILIIHTLFLIQQNKYSEIIDRTDALNQYCHRYLRKDETFRSNCFIKMLLQLPKANFNRIRTQRYAENYFTKLESVPLSIIQQGIEIEIIPYEKLWNIILDLLE